MTILHALATFAIYVILGAALFLAWAAWVTRNHAPHPTRSLDELDACMDRHPAKGDAARLEQMLAQRLRDAAAHVRLTTDQYPPGVGLALADLLDVQALHFPVLRSPKAWLALADLILGGAS